jgi:hypothetical protein
MMQEMWASEKDKLVAQLRDEYAARVAREHPAHKGSSWSFLFYAATGLLCLWIFGYVSGLFPYLGHRERVRSPTSLGLPYGNSIGSVGVPMAYLTKGQTVFIDYDVKVSGGGYLWINLQGLPKSPVDVFWPSAWLIVKTDQKGRLIYKIPQSGLYRVVLWENGPFASYGVDYKLSWGAVFADGLRGLPATDVSPEQMPIRQPSDQLPALPPPLGS